MSRRPSPDDLRLSKALSYANGYRELGMLKEARAELKALPEALREREPALQLALAIEMEARRWRSASSLARQLYRHRPDRCENAVNLAYAIRRAGSLDNAESLLREAESRFPDEAVVHFNLGCYACQRGDIEEAKSRLRQAFALDPDYLEIGKRDEDLAPLKDWLSRLDKPEG